MKACALIWLVGMALFVGGTTPVSPVPVIQPSNVVTHEIGPTLAGVLTLIVLQGVAVLTAYMAYRRAAATEKKTEAIEAKAGAIEAKVDATAAVQQEGQKKTDFGLEVIRTDVNSKTERMEQKLTDSQAQVTELIKQLASANATVIANAASAAVALSPPAQTAAVESMAVDAEHVTVAPAAKGE